MRLPWLGLLMCALTALPVAGSEGETVLLLHGLARGPLAMKRLEHALRTQGYAVHNVGYPSRRHDIATLAESALAPFLGPDGPEGRIHIVTHSLGGILVRQYLSVHGVPDRLGRVVMIAPPNQGSEVVDRLRNWQPYRWFNGPAGGELGTDTHALPQLLGGVPPGVTVGVIAGIFSWNPLLSSCLEGPNDGKVSLARTHVTGEQDHVVVNSSHTWIMWRRVTIDHVVSFLREGRFARTAPIPEST